MLRRQWLVVLLFLIVGTAAALGAAVWLPPRYSAEAIIEVVGPRDVSVGSTAAPMARIDPAVIQTMAQELRTRALAVHVVDKLRLMEDAEFTAPSLGETLAALLRDRAMRLALLAGLPTPTWTEPVMESDARSHARAVDALLRKLQVVSDDRSYLLKIRISDAVSEKAARIVNTVVDEHLARRLTARLDATSRVGEWLGQRVAEAGGRMRESSLAVQRFRDNRSLLTSEGETLSTGPTSQLAELYKQLVAAKSDAAVSESQLNDVNQYAAAIRQSARGRLQLDGAAQTSAAAVLASPVIQGLRTQQAAAARRDAQVRTVYGTNHPSFNESQAEIASLQSGIVQEVDRILAGLANNARTARARVAVLEQNVAELRTWIGQINRGEAELLILQQAADADRVVYQTLLTKLNDTANGFGLAPADVRVVAAAAPAVSPSFPKKGLFTAVGFTLSGILGIAFGLLRDQRKRTGFISSTEMEEVLGLPVGAMIPMVQLAEPAEGLRKRPNSAYAEAVRGVWPALGFSDDPTSRSVMITSSLPNEGKSTFVVSLADALAAGGRRVAIIDLDLRRAGLTTKLKLEKAAGIVQFLAQPAPAREFWLSCRPGVDVIPAGHGREQMRELLSAVATRAKLRALIDDLKQTHELVLIDSPPTLAVSDAAWLAKLTDGVIYAVRWQQTPRTAVVAGLNQLHVVGATVYGTVMTQVDLRRHTTYDSGDMAHFHRLNRRYYAG